MPVTNIVDGLITFRILKMLVTPWTSTDAFKLGIIDADGTPLKKSSELETPEEQSAYTSLWRLVFKLKRILGKIPVVNKNLVNFAAALWLIKECNEYGTEPDNLEDRYNLALQQDLSESMEWIHSFQLRYPSYELWKVINEEGAGAVAANNVGGGNIAGTGTDVARPMAKKVLKRKTLADFRPKKVT